MKKKNDFCYENNVYKTWNVCLNHNRNQNPTHSRRRAQYDVICLSLVIQLISLISLVCNVLFC